MSSSIDSSSGFQEFVATAAALGFFYGFMIGFGVWFQSSMLMADETSGFFYSDFGAADGHEFSAGDGEDDGLCMDMDTFMGLLEEDHDNVNSQVLLVLDYVFEGWRIGFFPLSNWN